MFERYTESARKAVVASQEFAREDRHVEIVPSDLLFGLVRGESLVTKVAAEEKWLSLPHVSGIATTAEPNPGQIPFAEETKKVLELALREALSLGHNYIEAEHLLFALLRTATNTGDRPLARLLMIWTGRGDPQQGTDFKPQLAEAVDEIRNAILKRLVGPGRHRSQVAPHEIVESQLEGKRIFLDREEAGIPSRPRRTSRREVSTRGARCLSALELYGAVFVCQDAKRHGGSHIENGNGWTMVWDDE